MATNDYVLPVKIEELIEDLDKKIYPLKSPNINDSEREIFFKAGQRDVVEFLKSKVKEVK